MRDLRRDLRQIEPNALFKDRNREIEKLNFDVRKLAEKIGIEQLEFLLGKTRGQGNQIDTGNNYEARRKRANDFLDEHKQINNDLTEIGNTLKTIYNDPLSFFTKSRNDSYKLFNPPESDLEERKKFKELLAIPENEELDSEYYIFCKAVRHYLWHFYDQFDAYD